MKIATFNINNVNKRLPNLLAWLKAEQPDVACLQELKAEQQAFPGDAIQNAGYGAIWVGQRAWNGVAILAKGTAPVLTRTSLPGDPDDKQARYIEAAVGGLLIACIYLPNGNPQPGPKFDYKLAWANRLIRHARKLLREDMPLVLAGDFNVVPTEEDIYPTKSWDNDALLQPKSRAAFQSLLKLGLTDSLRAIHPEGPLWTFWDYKRQRWPADKRLRLDHILLPPSIAARLTDAGVNKWTRGEPGASDHAPAWITLGQRKRKTRR